MERQRFSGPSRRKRLEGVDSHPARAGKFGLTLALSQGGRGTDRFLPLPLGEGRGEGTPKPKTSPSARTAWLVVFVAAIIGRPAPAAERPIALSEASQQGTFNVGPATATVRRVLDPTLGAEVLEVDFTMPKGTAAGVWSKAFPAGLDADHVDVVHVGVESTDADRLNQLRAALELKGSAGIQRIPLKLHPGWSMDEQELNWKTIGTLHEVVVSLERTGDAESVSGTVDLDVRFDRLSPLRRFSTSFPVRLGAIAVLSVLGALLMALLHRATGRQPGRERLPTTRAGGLKRDFVLGAGTVFIAALAIAVSVLGTKGSLEVGWAPLEVAVAGVALTEWLKFGLTGRHLTAGEVFRDLLATGLLATSSSGLGILQAPADGSQILMLSQPVAAAFVILYHGANAVRLASSGKHLGSALSALILGAPYVVGSLVTLASDDLVLSIGSMVTAGLLAGWPAAAELVGRVLVLLVFNEAVANGLGMATKRTWLASYRAHLAMLAVAVAAIASPWIAALGSSAVVASWPGVVRMVAAVVTTALSQAGLWAEVYLITGMLLDALNGQPPTRDSVIGHPVLGLKKGMIYSGTFMLILHGLGLLGDLSVVRRLVASDPVLLAAVFGALVYPLVKTIIETFDGSRAFFVRVARSYRNPVLYARGAVVGTGLGLGLALGLPDRPIWVRAGFGAGVGVAAFAGIDLLRDLILASRGQGRAQSWRVYLVSSLLGGFIGAALGFYFDAAQVAVVVEKFHRYLAAGQKPEPFGVYPILSKWGFINLGEVTGGVSLLYVEALDGVVSWSIPAWLFAINRSFMAAYFRKEASPIKALFTLNGLADLAQNMISVFRWGLWMSPIIKSFLRPTGDPTWYNQDGAIRTVIATAQDLTMSPEAFRAWSLQVFIYLLAYDSVRIAIWLDHFGLRVATLVNLSFLGMDRLDNRLARFLAPEATARCIPEGVKRFTTWAPLLIPFYIPRGRDWDYAWNQSQVLQSQNQGGPISSLLARPIAEQGLILAVAVVACTALFALARWLRDRLGTGKRPDLAISNPEYHVVLRANGEVFSRVPEIGYDVSRRSYDLIDPAGRTLFLVDLDQPAESSARAWPLVGNFPAETEAPSRYARTDDALTIENTRNGLQTTIEIRLPDARDPAELWTITVANRGDSPRRLKVIPYLEWVLNRPEADRGHTQYNRLFAEVEYTSGLHAVLAWDKHAKAMGFLASDAAPEGFLSARVDFIGRARSVWTPRVVETLAFTEARDTDAHPTLDPIGSLLLPLNVPARGSARLRLLIGLADHKARAIDLIARHLAVPGAGNVSASRRRKVTHPIGHGEVPPGTPRPYCEFSEQGRELRVFTPFTPRPYDHTMSNDRGHVVAVTNRGLHTSASVNAQQNRLTPDWPDTVTREVPGEAIYLYDEAAREWFSPTYHPLNDPRAACETEFGVDGSARFRMSRGTLETELTVFVPPDEPTGVYRLTVKNHAQVARRLRVAPYFQIVLADQPEHAGPLKIEVDRGLNAIYFENPRNIYRTGPAFAAISLTAERIETQRGRFFGTKSVSHPHLVEAGVPDLENTPDDRPIAAFLATIDVPPRGETTVVVLLGQADHRAEAEAVIRRYRTPADAEASLETTRSWWLALMETLVVETTSPEFDRYLDWLRYQALAERIWARRGFYQASGAFGFRDQLQDSVNLLWMDPAVARRQILLHASQQFVEGDVVHWFHRLQDGRTGFVARTHASDNLLWLAWAVVEYLGATGDDSILDERTSYLESEQPFLPLPADKHGMGFDPLRSSREDTVYRHCMKAINLVLDRRMGAHGLPLIGTGDWNDGLDEIGSRGKGESVWLGFFLSYILQRMAGVVEMKEGRDRKEHYLTRLKQLHEALERTWRDDRYLRAINDDGIEIGVKGSGVWEIDALTAAWAVMAEINPGRGRVVFETALRILEQETTILLGWPPLREDTKPYLGRSSWYPEGVRENGMYCHGVQWLAGAARLLAEQSEREGRPEQARRDRETAYRIWLKTSAIPHNAPGLVETYGGQPNQQAADMVTTFDPGRMIWNGYTGAAGWMFRQALEGVLGLRLDSGEIVASADLAPSGDLSLVRITRETSRSPFPGPPALRAAAQQVESEPSSDPSYPHRASTTRG